MAVPTPEEAQADAAASQAALAALMAAQPATEPVELDPFHVLEIPQPLIKRVEKIDWVRRFELNENVQLNILRKQVTEMTSADYADPTKQGLVAFEMVDQLFDLASAIEIDNPDTARGVGVMALLGVFGADGPTIAARQAAMLAWP